MTSRAFTVVLLALFAAALLPAQTRQHDEKAFMQSEMQRYAARLHGSAGRAVATQPIDVKYYRLDLTITTAPAYLRGSVLMNAVATQPGVSSIALDLMSSMHVDSIKAAGALCAFVQHPSDVTITLDRSYAQGEALSVTVYYQGTPGSSGFGSFIYAAHSSTPWIWSLSEPYGAKDWWPCIDHPSDKADSVDMLVTCNAAYKVGSNGRLLTVIDNGDGTHTCHWHEGYPISSYLVSVAITNYVAFSNWFKYSPTDSMEILNYVLPEHLSAAASQLPAVVEELRIYSDLFGLYPFVTEKYGHSEFGWGGGMEHQTMTSLGGFDQWLTAHELAHQWFGDMITTRTWPDIWLNEGFATYCELLYEERRYGEGNYWAGINSDMGGAKTVTLPVYVNDSESVGSLFDGNRVYNKGAVVLHMLRGILGDTLFFRSMYNYANDPLLRFGTASTEDFRGDCEVTADRSLTYFFNEWIYGERYPRYTTGWVADSTAGGFVVTLGINQTTETSNPSYFTMPVQVGMSAPGWDTTVTLFNNAQSQVFAVTLPFRPVSVRLDPQGWILKSLDTTAEFAAFPLALHLGTVFLPQSKQDSILVHNGGLVAMTISSVVADDPALLVAPASAVISPGATQKFLVTYHPATAGTLDAYILFYHNAAGSPGMIAVSGTASPTAYSYASSWNLISLPAAAPDPRVSVLFPGARFPAYSYSGSGPYTPAETLSIGTGYWLKFDAPALVPIGGAPCTLDTVQLRTGWNLIGAISSPIPTGDIGVEPDGTALSRFFDYNHRYILCDTLKPGRGYWVKSSGDGMLILSSSLPGAAARRPLLMADGGTPPLPPDGGPVPAGRALPNAYGLGQNYPNPCNPGTRIQYQLPAAGRVTMRLYNMLGEEVSTLVDAYEEAGYREVAFDGGALPSGVYVYRLTAGSFTATQKLLLMK